jgi:hypothetical protein
MSLENTLAYYDAATRTVVKSFMEQTPGDVHGALDLPYSGRLLPYLKILLGSAQVYLSPPVTSLTNGKKVFDVDTLSVSTETCRYIVGSVASTVVSVQQVTLLPNGLQP